MGKSNKIVKYIIISFLLVFSVLMSVASYVMLTEGEQYGLMLLVLFALATVINIGEIIRVKRNKTYIFLPMLGMYLVAIMTALLLEFIREAVGGDGEAIGPIVLVAICETITILSMYGLNYGMTKKP